MDYKYIPYDFSDVFTKNRLMNASVVEKRTNQKYTIYSFSDYDEWEPLDESNALLLDSDSRRTYCTAKKLFEDFVDEDGNPVGRKVTDEQERLFTNEKLLLESLSMNGSLNNSDMQKALSNMLYKLLDRVHTTLFDRVTHLEKELKRTRDTLEMKEDELLSMTSEKNSIQKAFDDYKERISVVDGEFTGKLYKLCYKSYHKECPLCHGTGKRDIIYTDTGEKGTVDCPAYTIGYRYWLEPTDEFFTMIVNPDKSKTFVVYDGGKMFLQEDDEGHKWYNYSYSTCCYEECFSYDYFENEEDALDHLKKTYTDFQDEDFLGIKEPSK